MGKITYFLRLALCIVIFFTCSGIQPAWAQSDDDLFELFDVSLEELLNVGLVSATKKKQNVADAPATAHVVTHEQIVNRGYANLMELLEDIPEIEIQKNSNPDYRNQLTFRGVSGNEKILILLNGVRITPATGDAYILGANFSITQAKRVEVILGPASALYGVDAFAGIINIITGAESEGIYEGTKITTSYGLYNTHEHNFLVGTKLDKVGVNLSGSYTYSDEPNYAEAYPTEYLWYENQYRPYGKVIESPFYGDVVEVNEINRWYGNSVTGPSISRVFNMPSSSYFLNGTFEFNDFTFGFNRHSEKHSSAFGIDPRFGIADSKAFIEMSQQVFYGKHDYTSFNRKWGLQTTFIQSFYEYNPESNFVSAASRWQRGYIYAFGQSAKIEEQFSYDFSSKFSLISGVLFENLTALPRTGLSPKPFDRNEPSILQDLYFIGAAGYKAYISPNDTAVFNDSIAILQDFYNLNYRNFGGFLQFQITPFKMLEITIGSRYDFNTRFGGSFNPRLGLVFKPIKKFHFKLLYGESFLAPSPEKAYEQSGAFFGVNNGVLDADFFRITNPELKPEKLRSGESSISFFLNSNMSFSANGFYTRISDLIDLFGEANPNDAPDNLNASKLETSINKGSSEVYGGTARLNTLFKMGKTNFNSYISFSYIDGNIDNRPLLYSARETVKGGVDITARKLTLSPRVIHRTPSNSSLIDSFTGQYLSNYKYTTLNVTLNYKLKDKDDLKIMLYVKGYNVTDLRYYNVFSGNEEGMALTPQDPLRVNLGLKIEL